LNTPSVYLCGPIIKDEGFSRQWRNDAADYLLDYDITALDPCRGKNWGDVNASGMDTADPLFTKGRFVTRDLLDIDRCDLVLFVWPGEPGRQSIGTFFELGYAHALRKPIVVVCDDSSVVAQHPFISETCTAPFTKLSDALAFITRTLTP
jgi:nucleoside 2-deoxyribosyltransferase